MASIEHTRPTGNQAAFVNAIVQAVGLNEFSFHVLDAPPGTGKTFSVISLERELQKLGYRLGFIVYSNDLVSAYQQAHLRIQKQNQSPQLETCSATVCALTMSLIGLKFEAYKQLFVDSDTWVSTLYEAYKLAFKSRQLDVSAFKNFKSAERLDVLVVDEYTVVAPVQLLYLYFVCRRDNVVLVMCGDRNQQAAIGASKFITGNNFAIANALCDHSHELVTQHRSRDPAYTNFLTALKSNVINGRLNTPMGFIEKLFVFEHLADRFEKSLELTNVFLASYHKDLRARVLACPHAKMWPWVTDRETGTSVPFTTRKNFGRVTYLPLILGAVYQFSLDERRNTKLGRLESYTVDEISIRETNGALTVLQRVPMMASVNQEVYQVLRQAHKGLAFSQFNARLMFVTYHAVQGMTLPPDVQLDLNLDGMSVNAIYVGLSRVVDPSQINAIVSQDFESLKFTHEQNDGWLYKIRGSGSTKSRKFQVADTYENFERATVQCKFDRSNLQSSKPVVALPMDFEKLKAIPCHDLLNEKNFKLACV